MKVAYLVLSWFFGIIFGLLALSMLLTKNWLQAIALLLIVLLLLPPLAGLVQSILGRAIPVWIRVVSIVVLLAIFVALMNINQPSSIYKSPEIEARFMEMYDARLEAWPVAYQSVFVDTSYGKIHVIISGPEDAPPVLLLHASGVAGWSWIYNVEELSKHYRTYAIDTLGDAGKSVLYDLDTYPPDGPAQSALITELTEKLGIGRADVVGASEGGFIGTNYALYAPERVQKLILLGPMGYAGTNASILRIMLAQFYPLKPVQESTFRWAFGDDPRLNEGFGEWFRLLMAGVFPRKARPTLFTPEQLQGLDVPVLLVLGKKDKLVGDPENAKMQAQDIPDLRVEILDSGHLIGAEQPEQVNSIIIEFLGVQDTQP
ncbi:MAG: alpha/beta fold hydrolase [Anaerolineales bacterium]|nr:MAG: alpha/beta fold hydrolase [Anaerolineales bacterium]